MQHTLFKLRSLALLVAAACNTVAADEATLKDTVVSATLSEHDTRTAPASVTVVTQEELATRNAVDLLDAVRGTPGTTLSPRQVGDNFVFRAGFAPTAVAARQLVSHRHVHLNGRPVSIASIRIRPGDTISLADKARKIPMVVECLAEPALTRPFNETAVTATVTRLPEAGEVPFPIDVQHVVEYYAVRI